MQNIVNSYEPEGVRGVSITIRDIQNIARVNRQFHAAQQRAYEMFVTKLPRIVDYEDPEAVNTQFTFMCELNKTMEELEMSIGKKASGNLTKDLT